jgi:hypothetical protein
MDDDDDDEDGDEWRKYNMEGGGYGKFHVANRTNPQ